jgi:cobalt/nickel transport system permease protein
VSLPAWLAARPPSAAPCPTSTTRRRASFAERTLVQAAAFLRDALEAGRDAERPGALQGLDARAKVFASLALLIGVATSRSLVATLAVALAAVVLAAASRLDVARYLRRVWLVVPLFTAAIALPATLDVATPGPALLDLTQTPAALVRLGWPETLSVTTTGLVVAARLVLRAGASLSIVALLAQTTPAGDVLKALRSLGVPQVFVLVAAMTQRYLRTLVTTIEELHLALVSRRIRPLTTSASREFVASRLGVVLTKSRATAEEVHLAMVSRGFRGEVRTLTEPRLRAQDLGAVVWAVLGAVAVALASHAGLP